MGWVIKECGGSVHYSQEFWVYLSGLPKKEANRIVAEIEHRNRYRRWWEYDGNPYSLEIVSSSDPQGEK